MYTPISLTEPVPEQDDNDPVTLGWQFVSWFARDSKMSPNELIRWIFKVLLIPTAISVIVYWIYPLALFPIMLICAVFCSCFPPINTMLWVTMLLLLWGGWTATNKPLTLQWGGVK